MELEIENELTLINNNIFQLYEEITQLESQIQENQNKNKKLNIFNRFITFLYEIKDSEFFLRHFIIGITFGAIISKIMIPSLLYNEEYNYTIIKLLLLVIIINGIIYYSSSIIQNALNNESKTTNGFFSNLKYKIKEKYNKFLFLNNTELINKKEKLSIKVKQIFNRDLMDDIYSFYQNHDYSQGSQENLILTNNFEKIKKAYKEQHYYTILDIYKKDIEKYNYLNLNNKI